MEIRAPGAFLESGLAAWRKDENCRLKIGFPLNVLSPGTPKGFCYCFSDLLFGDVSSHARAQVRHGIPVCRIDKYGVNKGPGPAHAGFEWMDGAFLVPEDAVAVFFLCEQGLLAGPPAISGDEKLPLDADIPGNGRNVFFGDVCPAVSAAAIPAHPAGKDFLGIHGRFHFLMLEQTRSQNDSTMIIPPPQPEDPAEFRP
jgi:hypothetical protein